MSAAVNDVKQSYPRLGKIPFTAQWGPEGSPYHMEFYQPWQEDNPNQGVPTVEVYDRNLKGKDLSDAIAADMLHHLGAIDPRSGQPVDSNWRTWRQQFMDLQSPQGKQMDRNAYDGTYPGSPGPSEHKQNGQPFETFMEQSRIDAWIRGAVFHQWPDEVFTPDQLKLARRMRRYLERE
jgi:hypothetical protein